MIKIALKHWIYEKCIDVFFKAITNNFIFDHKQNEFNPGERFSSIVIKLPNLFKLDSNNVKIYTCTILDNLEGTVLIQFYSKHEKNSEYERYGKPLNWRVNITDIVEYRRYPIP